MSAAAAVKVWRGPEPGMKCATSLRAPWVARVLYHTVGTELLPTELILEIDCTGKTVVLAASKYTLISLSTHHHYEISRCGTPVRLLSSRTSRSRFRAAAMEFWGDSSSFIRLDISRSCSCSVGSAASTRRNCSSTLSNENNISPIRSISSGVSDSTYSSAARSACSSNNCNKSDRTAHGRS